MVPTVTLFAPTSTIVAGEPPALSSRSPLKLQRWASRARSGVQAVSVGSEPAAISARLSKPSASESTLPVSRLVKKAISQPSFRLSASLSGHNELLLGSLAAVSSNSLLAKSWSGSPLPSWAAVDPKLATSHASASPSPSRSSGVEAMLPGSEAAASSCPLL